MSSSGDRIPDPGPVSVEDNATSEAQPSGPEKVPEAPKSEVLPSDLPAEAQKEVITIIKAESSSNQLPAQNTTNGNTKDSGNQKPPETTKKTVMTLSVANLMSDPTPLNALHSKAPTVTIKTNQSVIRPASVQKFTGKTIATRSIKTIIKPQSDLTFLQPARLLIIQAPNRQSIEIPQTTFNQNFAQYNYGTYYGQPYQVIQGSYPNIPQTYNSSYPIPTYQMPQTYTPPWQKLPQPAINIAKQPPPQNQKNHQHDLMPPEPTYYTDEDSGQYGVRCTCGDNHNRGLLVQCEKCQFWLHGICVNCPRASSTEQFLCPFCQAKRLRCRCKKNKSYNIPIVQCSHCKLYLHKQCEGLGFGIIPKPFVCCQCHKTPFELPYVKFDPIFKEIRDFTVYVDPARYEVTINIPDGNFKTSLEQDLTKSEISFIDTMTKYFNKFCVHLLGNSNQEIWNVFTSTFSTVFNCSKELICAAIDHLTYQLLYAHEYTPYMDIVPDFGYSEAIAEYVETFQGQSFDKLPTQTQLTLNSNLKVISPVSFNDGDFICDLPGFLMHTDEVFSDNGIPPTCLAVDNTVLVIDMSGSKFNLATNFRRSMHSNTAVRLIIVDGKPRVALFATKLTGPLADDKNGQCIKAGEEVILPFDGELPYHVETKPWKGKKQRSRQPVKQKEEKKQQKKKVQQQQKKKPPTEPFPPLTLLSSFLEDIIPPIPVQIISDEEMADRMRTLEKGKERRLGRSQNEDYVFE
ncbi:PHD-finger family protein [Trichomonas vaginalis G3]|uniref:PHD-finger family protein n=2 Tax=Trichomonas vaginalis (strain ATCC PRA-98 / G3) TaxID=412133 RepID=A2DVH1_TRIV3|nr:PHD-finger family protein [Trichomonas vaginalis G3]|eukprot:XP_001327873.1 PHD-finger family protein [Trichomonas vaginalis G3]